MSTRDDDPDDPVTPGEEARAAGFARLVDDLLAGEPSPPAMDADDRALLEAATVVVASSRAIELDPEATHRVIDRALELAVGGRRGRASASLRAVDPSASSSALFVRRRADRALRILPWAVASLAAAAAIFLFVTRPAHLTGDVPTPPAQARLAPSETSRPSDDLIGRIPRAELDQASRRLDTIYGDRLAGYRELVLAGGGR